MINILHLTDFHLNPKNLKDWNNYIKEALFNRIEDSKLNIDLILFTGDLIDIGGKEYSSPIEAFSLFKASVIDELLSKLNLPIEKFLIIPGNHDIVRSEDSFRDELGSQEFFKKSEAVSEFIDSAIKNTDYSGFKRIKDYKAFENDLYKTLSEDLMLWTIFGNSFKLKINDKKVGIACLNSAWRCYDSNDKGRLLIGENHLNRLYGFIKDCDIKIAMVHHPLDMLSEVERRTVTSHITKEFDLLW